MSGIAADSDLTRAATGPSARMTCARCARPLAGHVAFVLGQRPYCWHCVPCQRVLLRRSAITALIVGTVLVAINQGTVLVTGQFPSDLLWKMPLTYLVPFCVASWGALSNSRIKVEAEEL